MKTSVKGFMFYVAFVASLGGLLFGFDTAVISGAEKAIQGIYALSDFAHGFTIATALIGTIVGALVCGGPAERYGRLRSLKVIAWLYPAGGSMQFYSPPGRSAHRPAPQ